MSTQMLLLLSPNVSVIQCVEIRDSLFHSVFAPIGLIIKYDTVEQAIEIANSTRYGLGASVFGPVRETCLKVAKRLQCGMVAINDFGVFYVSGILWHMLYTKLTVLSAQVRTIPMQN